MGCYTTRRTCESTTSLHHAVMPPTTTGAVAANQRSLVAQVCTFCAARILPAHRPAADRQPTHCRRLGTV